MIHLPLLEEVRQLTRVMIPHSFLERVRREFDEKNKYESSGDQTFSMYKALNKRVNLIHLCSIMLLSILPFH